MSVDYQLLFFFSGLGAFNGLLLSLYFLFFARPKHLSNIFLGALLAMLSIRIGKSVFFFFNRDLAKIYLQIGLSACFFIGPFLYLYVRSKIEAELRNDYWKYALMGLLALVIGVGSAYPYEAYPEIWGDYFYQIIIYQWLFCILISSYWLIPSFKKLGRPSNLNHEEVWLLSVFFGVTAIWTAYYTSNYTSYIMGALAFSFVLYLSISVLWISRKRRQLEQVLPKEKYANKKIEASEAEELLTRIENLMQEEELYKDPNLSLTKLAKKLMVSSHLLSQLLNDNLEKRFSQFINEYRIDEAKRILSSQSNLKMEAIAEECGFNSNSTFYATFKKFTNTTPAKFMSEKADFSTPNL